MHWWDPQLKEYQALPVWKDFPSLWEGVIEKAGARAEDYPFWLLTARSMQYAWGANMGIQLMKEVAENVTGHRGVIINAGAAAKLGIADGDPIEISTPKRTIRGRAVVRQGIRPDTLLAIGQFDHWMTPLAKDFGMASLNSLATMSIELTDATGSGADIVRVKLARAVGGVPS
jgi:phenylacetyl-CoA:acceptor oxidoreductase